MPPLKNLEEQFPIIDAAFRRFCASHGIFSVEDFLVRDVSMLADFAEREANPEVLKEGITQVMSVIDIQHQPWLNGVELLGDANQNKHFLSTGFKRIDMLLGGGLRQGQLTEIVGPSASGKTQVCLTAASHVAAKHSGSVMFLDTCNSFSPDRIVSIVGRHSYPLIKEGADTRIRRILNAIICQPVFNIFELLNVVHQLHLTSKHQVTSDQTRLCLVIVDSISSLISPILGGKDSQGRMLMVSAGTLLTKLATECNVSVLVTNHMVGGVGGISKPALGESWKSIPHVRIQVSRDQGNYICHASVLKHTFLASGLTTDFTLDQ